ncbi:unnamed protein product [Clavelina lepadiformis]|uniref:Metalloendopeptidase n=1 Tax=Clavelina lepadiformis TaxID=159417 RepID=A0ABP0G3X7_CLALP
MTGMTAIWFTLFLAFTAAEGKHVLQVRISTRGGNTVLNNLQKANDVAEDNNAPEDSDIMDINLSIVNCVIGLKEGDILPNRNRNTLVDESRLWSSTAIPVSYSPNLNLEAICTIEEARREYEMRTCIQFVDRSTETDYIYFEPLSGCYSSVGWIGGKQTVSIGSGCEKMAIVQHELMHAIGVYHEQSRTDRDNYVKIMYENVESGKEHNFNSYSFDVVDDRRVPYDYNSVMHYGDTSFSSNDQPTIITYDDAFQDVIGQRRTFSRGDVTKINRMYKCSDALRVSYNCNFEKESMCGYIQDLSDERDWNRYSVVSGNSDTAPITDGTMGVEGKGSYMLLDTSVQGEASMYSMKFKSKVKEQCLEFSYYMNLSEGSYTSLSVHIASIDSSTGDIVSRGPALTTISRVRESAWNIERLTINAPSEYKLEIRGIVDRNPGDIIAIDDISILDKPCETGYFIIRNYKEILETTSVGDYVYSPIMYTEDGYAYQVKVYPVGSSKSKEGYMAMYYYVAIGKSDDSLNWPFDKRVIKLKVVDQGPDPLTRMSQYSNFETSATSSAWEKPTSSRNSGYGYSSFMPISDVKSTKHFIKHDFLMVSVQVTDMSSWLNAKSSQTSSLSLDISEDETKFEKPANSDTKDGFGEMPLTSAFVVISLTTASIFLLMLGALVLKIELHSKDLNKTFIN